MGVMEVDGLVYEEDEEVGNLVVQFYESLCQETEGWRPKVDGLNFANIGEDECNMLERMFEEEITQVVKKFLG